MAKAIRNVGIVGPGVIGSSWTVLFLAKVLKVLVSDPTPHAKENLEPFITREWTYLGQIGLIADANAKNYQFFENVVIT